MGYLKQDEMNLKVFDVEGYYHTGDIGYLNDQKRLQITGRLNEVIVTAGDFIIYPEPIELALTAICPIISYCVVVGNMKKYLSMLITLKSGYDKYGQATNELDPGVQSFLFRMFAVNIMTIKEAKNSK